MIVLKKHLKSSAVTKRRKNVLIKNDIKKGSVIVSLRNDFFLCVNVSECKLISTWLACESGRCYTWETKYLSDDCEIIMQQKKDVQPGPTDV